MRPPALATALVLLLVLGATEAQAATISTSFTTSSGTVVRGTLTGDAPLTARPTIVEFSPYGSGNRSYTPTPAYNSLVIEDPGTGRSSGSFDTIGPDLQQTVSETLGWACKQPWSDGRLGLWGFSASAITVYNSMHLPLPCVRAAALRSGTFELYRDLLTPGGTSNAVPGAVVLGAIGGAALLDGPQRDLTATPQALLGFVRAGLNVLAHPSLDRYWRDRGFRGDVNRFPVLAIAGFYDVESRGAFEGYRALKGSGAHLLVANGHDQQPRGTDGGVGETNAWFDRYVRGIRNGVDRHPRVQMQLSAGSRESFVAGDVVRRTAKDWPVPGTRWRSLWLDPARSGTARSLNDGTLAGAAPAAESRTSYPAIASLFTQTDVPTAAIVDGAGFSALSAGFPALTSMALGETLGASWTTPPLTRDLTVAGPAALDVTLSSTAPSSTIWAVVSDVGPDGVPHPIGVGRLSTDYPGVDAARSLADPRGDGIVQPYGAYDAPSPATPGVARRYQVELWPLGNVFRAGHRIRLHLVGQSVTYLPKLPGVNTVVAGGGAGASRLRIPVLPRERAAKPKPKRTAKRPVRPGRGSASRP